MSSDAPATESAAPSLASRITKDAPSEGPAAAAPAPADDEESDDQLDGAGKPNGGGGLEEPEYDVVVKLSDLQAGEDDKNPLASKISSFEDLHLSPEIIKGLVNMSFRKPSKIQGAALPLLLSTPTRNLIGQSQSGTGKTAAFVINMLTKIDLATKQPQALVLAPTRELARQIQGVVRTMGQFMPDLVVTAAIPDPSRRGKIEGQIIIGTPGTVQDVIKKRFLDPSQMKVLVLDEADNMLDMQGLGDQCRRVKALLPRSVQVVLFSATFPDQVTQFAKIFAPAANEITLQKDELNVEGIKQFFFDCDSEETKYTTLVKFYGLLTISSSIIFCKRRDTAIEIERRMVADGHQVAHLSGALEGADRDAVIDRFRSGAAKVLITTNVLSRGIDVQSVTMVVNYDVPELHRGQADPETYLHRIGRTGRFGRVGVAISFISDRQGWQMLKNIAEHFAITIEPLPTDDWDDVESRVKKVIKSGRAGKTTKQMQGDMQVDGASVA